MRKGVLFVKSFLSTELHLFVYVYWAFDQHSCVCQVGVCVTLVCWVLPKVLPMGVVYTRILD